MILKLQVIFLQWLEVRRQGRATKLLRRYIDNYLLLHPMSAGVLYCNHRKHRVVGGEDQLIMAQPVQPNQMLIYLACVNEMFENRINRIIQHELAHLAGANEVEAAKAEPEEPAYRGLDDN